MEALAGVVSELRAGKYRRLIEPRLGEALNQVLQPALRTIVDATAVYLQKCEPEPYNFYDDHPSCAPPWFSAAICFENKHGNVFVMPLQAVDRPFDKRDEEWAPDPEDNKVVDWLNVRWVMDVPLYVGGKNGLGERVHPSGPVFLWRLAVYSTGALADVRWVHVAAERSMTDEEQRAEADTWDLALLVLLGTLNFMGCRNVELVPAQVPRAERRRIERIDPRFEAQVLAVRPTGRRSQGTTAAPEGSLPMSSVVGHPAHYGNCCPGLHEPRGLLFGKLEGRFWIPQHARGSAEFGVRQNDYTIQPDGGTNG